MQTIIAHETGLPVFGKTGFMHSGITGQRLKYTYPDRKKPGNTNLDNKNKKSHFAIDKSISAVL